MATDSEKLILSISADVTQVKRALTKLSGDTKNETDKMRISFDGVGKSATRAAANVNQASQQMTVSMKQTRAATVNMTAQFNDIAQQLAAGTSPLTIMAQQSSQVAQAMQAAGGGVKGFATTVVGAFKGMLSWQSLVAAGSILALGAVVNYFSKTDESAKETEKRLDEHKKLIEDIGKAWNLSQGSLTDYFTASKNATGADLAKAVEDAQKRLAAAREKILSDTSGGAGMGAQGGVLNTLGITGERGISNWLGLGAGATGATSLFNLDENKLAATPGFDKLSDNIQRIKTELAELTNAPFPAPGSEEKIRALNAELKDSTDQLADMAKGAVVADSSFGPLQDRITQLRKDLESAKPGAALQFLEELQGMRTTSLFTDMSESMKSAIDNAIELAKPLAEAEKEALALKNAADAVAETFDVVATEVLKIQDAAKKAFDGTRLTLQQIPPDLKVITFEMQNAIDKINSGLNPAFEQTRIILQSLPAELRKLTDEAGGFLPQLGQLTGVPGDLASPGAARAAQGRQLEGSAGAIDAFVERVVQAESGGRADAKNPLSSATGAGQFIESTWLRMMESYFPERTAGKTRAEILGLRTDAELSRQAIRRYAEENAVALKNAGQTVTEASLQLAHFLGPGGATAVLNAAPGTRISDIAAITPAARAANPSILGGGATREDVLAYADRRASSTKAPRAKKEEKTPEMKFAEDLEQSAAATKVLNAELQVLAANNGIVEDFGYATEYAKKQQELLNKAQAEGVTITPALTAQINAASDAYARATAAIKFREEAAKAAEERQAESLKRWDELGSQIGDVAKSAISGFVSDLRAGVDAGEAFTNMLDGIIDSLINMAIESLFSKDVLGTLFSGLGGGLFGGGASPLSGMGIAGNAFKAGGTVGMSKHSDGRSFGAGTWAGAPRFATGGVVGLRPGEVPIIAHKGEMIIPAGQAGKSGSTVDNSVHQQNTMSIDMSQTGAVAANSEDAKLFGLKIQKMVQLEMVRESRPGGLLRQGRGIS